MKDGLTSPQLQSRSYRLAALDPYFLLGESMRCVRLLLEFSKAPRQALRRSDETGPVARVELRFTRRLHLDILQSSSWHSPALEGTAGVATQCFSV